jgi:hypothetical protein
VTNCNTRRSDMKITHPFGFITGCFRLDLNMVQATLASIRHYCGDVPICLIVDDDHVDVSSLVSLYQLQVLRVSNIESDRIRRLIQRSTRSKLAAIWEGPFERFIWMDSDAIVWGDITPAVRHDVDFQIFWDEISIPADQEAAPEWLAHFYFDAVRLRAFDPYFSWRGKAYFCDGVFACRRGAIPVEAWEEALSWRESGESPWPSNFSCMPMMNYIVHSMVDRGLISIAMTDLQHIPIHRGREEIDADLVGAGWCFPQTIKRPRVLHFCGRKPYTFYRGVLTKPFTIARLSHYRSLKSACGAWLSVLREDAGLVASKVAQRIMRRIRKSTSRL